MFFQRAVELVEGGRDIFGLGEIEGGQGAEEQVAKAGGGLDGRKGRGAVVLEDVVDGLGELSGGRGGQGVGERVDEVVESLDAVFAEEIALTGELVAEMFSECGGGDQEADLMVMALERLSQGGEEGMGFAAGRRA